MSIILNVVLADLYLRFGNDPEMKQMVFFCDKRIFQKLGDITNFGIKISLCVFIVQLDQQLIVYQSGGAFGIDSLNVSSIFNVIYTSSNLILIGLSFVVSNGIGHALGRGEVENAKTFAKT